MRILFVGDVVGRPGREALARWLPVLKKTHTVDMVIANGENAAGGLGMTPATAQEILSAGVDAITLGNHAWKKKELVRALDTLPQVVRPANYPEGAPGKGARIINSAAGTPVGVLNLAGRVYMDPVECPFRTADRLLRELREETSIVIVDMHAEATSEKVALGWHLDGRCSAVLGTHTHVQTADERILPAGTAYISDVGMTGAFDSVIGVETELVVRRFLTGLPVEFKVAEKRPGINAVLLDIDKDTGQARSIMRVAEIGG